MTEPVNLRRHRKRRAREEKERLAAENRVRFGTPKAETARREAVVALESRRLDGKRRERDGE